jgi:hypothetical protein
VLWKRRHTTTAVGASCSLASPQRRSADRTDCRRCASTAGTTLHGRVEMWRGGSRPIAAIAPRGNRATSSFQPGAPLVTQKARPPGRIATSKRSIETSIPTL